MLQELVHLAIDQAGLVDNARIAHLEEQVGSLTGTLAYTGEYRSTTMLLSEVVDEFLNDNGLTNTSAAEQTRLATLDEGLDQSIDLMPVSKISVVVVSSS